MVVQNDEPGLDSGRVMRETKSLPSPLLQVNSNGVEGKKNTGQGIKRSRISNPVTKDTLMSPP